jgi:hypothetical protein
MKSFRSIIVIIPLLIIISSLNIKKEDPVVTKSITINVTENQLTSLWKKLFLDPEKLTVNCEKNHGNKDEEGKVTVTEESIPNTIGEKGQWSLPRKKTNYYESKMIGWDNSAYLFDYLDPLFQTPIVKAFKQIYEIAFNTVPDEGFKDPYTLTNMLNTAGSEEDLLKKLKSLVPKFDENTWKVSISMAKIDKFLTISSWYTDSTKDNLAKNFVDKFDFNGDGRLSPKEFIIASIINNKSMIGSTKCTNCYNEIVNLLLDPIFTFLDCNNKDKICAEDMWNGLRKLKRRNIDLNDFQANSDKPDGELTKGWDIYQCELKGNGEKYRTNAVNDFIIKAHKTIDGYVNKQEFILGILQGYWARQVDDNTIYKDPQVINAKNMKSFRWENNGEIDKMCNKLKSLHNN